MKFGTVFRAAAVAALCATAAPAEDAIGPFTRNADGLTLSEVIGGTLVGVTRDDSKTWSVFLGKDGTARERTPEGRDRAGTWRQPSRNIICFKWSTSATAREDCKLAEPRGRGLDWRGVGDLRMDGNILKYVPNDRTETAGHSQIVYRYSGEVAVAQNSYLPDLGLWQGRVVVGRTLKERLPWMMRLNRDRTVVFASPEGKVLQGRYTTGGGTICMSFETDKQAGGCHRPVTRSGRNLWQDAKTGQTVSEIVYLTPAEPPPPGPGEVAIARHNRLATFDLVEVSADASVAVAIEATSRRLRLIEPFSGNPLAMPDLLDGLWRRLRISGIDISDDGGVIAFTDRTRIAVIRRDEPDRPFAEVFLDDLWPQAAGRQALDIDLSPDGSRLAVALGQPGVAMLETRDLSLLWIGKVRVRAAEVEFAPDGVSLAAAADGGSVVTMETETGQQRASGLYGGLSDIAHWLDYEKTRNEAARRRLQVSDMAYSPDGTRLMVATWGGVLATLEVGETRLSRLLEADLDTAIRDLDIIAARAGEAPQVLVALKDAPTLYRRIDGSEPDRRFGPGSRAAIEADVLSAAPLIVLRASPDGGLDLWASSRIGENRALRRAEAAQAASPALSRRYNAALRAGIAEVAERGAAIRNAFASGDCARFDSFGRQAALYQQQQDQTCPQRAEAARISALETQLLEQIRSGGCEAAERLWQQLGAPGVVRGNVFDRPAREVCRTVAEMVSLGREIEQQKAAGRCGRMEELTAALLDTLATLPPGPGARPLSDAERDRTILKAETDCEATRILEHAGAQEMFLAAVRKEAAGDTRAARKIYEALMTRHVDDPVALKAGDRMIALIDRSAAPGAAAPAAPPKAGAAPDAAPGDVIVPFGAAPKP